MADYFTDFNGLIWVQPDGPNTEPKPLFCHNIGDLDSPLGDVTTTVCRGPFGDWNTANRTQGGPSSSTFTVESWLRKTRGWLQKQVERRCQIPVYVHWTECPPDNVFLNYDTGRSMRNGLITSNGMSDMVMTMGEEGLTATNVGQSFEFNGEPMPPFYWKLVLTIRSVAEAEQLRDIAFCNAARCDGPCGSLEDICTDGIIAADMTAAAAADVWFTTNGWSSGAAGAGNPFAADEAVASACCVYMDKDSVRHIVVRGTTDGANPAEIAYSDDAGATWTTVNVGSTNGEYALHGGALFALNHDAGNIWLCTDQGNVFKSEDGGVTWTDQNAPTPVGGAEGLMCVRFADERYGMCVGGTTGASSVFLYTDDGGAHWNLGTGAAAVLLTGVSVIDNIHAWVTTEGGALYYTNDYGTNWTARALTSTPDALGDVHFINQYVGATGGFETVSGDELGTIWRTFDGGWSWEEYQHDTAFDSGATYGVNSVYVCDINHIYGVGEPVDSLGLIMELSAKGSV
jgi:photosystem II stability/assembly factor-like uncharacterized protein